MRENGITQISSNSNKRIAKNTLYLYVRMLFVMGVSLYTSRIVLAELGITDYGIYNVVGSVVTIFTFISQALGNATNRFIIFSIGKGDEETTNRVYNTCFRVHFFIAFFVVLLLETVGLWFLGGRLNIPAERVNAAYWVFHISVAVCFLSIIRVPSTAEVIAHEDMGFYAVISIIETLLKLIIAISLKYYSNDKLVFYASLLFGVQFIVNYAFHIYCKSRYVECVLSLKMGDEKKMYKEIGSFAGWSMLGNIVWLGYTQGINLMLNIFFGPVVNAARGIAVQVESAVTTFVGSFQTAINPQITKSYAKNDLNRMHSLIVYSSKFSFFLYLLFAVPIFFEAENILGIWLVEVPDHAINFVRLTLIFELLTPLSNPLGTSNDATGKIRNYQIVCGLINLQIIVVSYILLKLGHVPEVVFFVQISIFAVQTVAKLLFIRKQVHLSLRFYFKEVIAPITTVAFFSAGLSYGFLHFMNNSIISVFLYLVLSFLLVAGTSYLFGLNINERAMVRSLINKHLKRSNIPIFKRK